MPALPSAGRELVPYFRSPDDCVNETLTQSKADSARCVLSVTFPLTSQNSHTSRLVLRAHRKRKKSGKKSPAASTHLSLVDSRDSSPGKATIKRAAQKLQDANLCGDCIQSKRSFPQGVSPQGGVKRNTSARTPTASAKDLKAWAGPSYCTSPPPEHLPMPTAFLLAV